MNPLLDEVFRLWPAYSSIVEYVSRTHATEADPHDIYGKACSFDQDRLAALLYAHQHADTMDEARTLLAGLMVMCRDGRRPRFGREVGITRESLGGAL